MITPLLARVHILAALFFSSFRVDCFVYIVLFVCLDGPRPFSSSSTVFSDWHASFQSTTYVGSPWDSSTGSMGSGSNPSRAYTYICSLVKIAGFHWLTS